MKNNHVRMSIAPPIGVKGPRKVKSLSITVSNVRP